MTSFLQYGWLARPGPGFRPAVVGALACGALMLSAGAAQANHMKMADGTLCPHAAGTPVPGEMAPAPGPERAGSTAPIAPARPVAAQPGQPATKSASQAPSQRAGAQAQAQGTATSQAQAQRPAATVQPVTNRATVSVSAPRQVPVARPSVAQQPRAERSTPSAVTRQASRPVVEPAVAADTPTVLRVRVEHPAAYAVTSPDSADAGAYVPTALLLGLLALCGIVAAAVVAVRRSRVPAVRHAATLPSFVESMDAAIEAELQEMIIETTAHAPRAPAGIEDGSDDRELCQTR